MNACSSDRRLDRHCTFLACRLARLTTGMRIDISTAMIPITTISSTRENARARRPGALAGWLESGMFRIGDAPWPGFPGGHTARCPGEHEPILLRALLCTASRDWGCASTEF